MLQGPTEQNPPVSLQLDLSSGLTDLCVAGLQCGFIEPPPRCRDASFTHCDVCRDAQVMVEERLFFSMLPLELKPHSGHFVSFSTDSIVTESTSARVELMCWVWSMNLLCWTLFHRWI